MANSSAISLAKQEKRQATRPAYVTQFGNLQPCCTAVNGNVSCVGRRRGFFAVQQHRQQSAEERAGREEAATVCGDSRDVRDQGRVDRDREHAVRDPDGAERRVHQETQCALAEVRTAQAAETLEQIDSILSATRDVDEVVVIDSLRLKYEPPPFDRVDLISPIAPPALERPPAEPVFNPPPEPTGVSKMFGRKAHAQAVEAARAEWQVMHAQWADYVNRALPQKNAAKLSRHAAAEKARQEELAAEMAHYERLCAEQKRHIEESNALLEQLREALEAGDHDAIDDYIGLVLNNSVYPEEFEVDHNYRFEPDDGKLFVELAIPAPDTIPAIKAYEYVAASDELRAIPVTQKEQRTRYNTAVAAVAVRTFRDVFAADRGEYVKTISLSVETTAIYPATGLTEDFVFIRAAADHSEFMRLDVSHVGPIEALTYIRSSVSDNAFGLETVKPSRGVG
jgi:restriction system protein